MRFPSPYPVAYATAAAILSLLACSSDSVTGPTDVPTPGWIAVNLATASSRPAGAITVRLSGDSITDLRAPSAYTLSSRGAKSTSARVLLVGSLTNGTLFEFSVPDTRLRARYVVTVDQVADDSTFAQRDAADFTASIAAP